MNERGIVGGFIATTIIIIVISLVATIGVIVGVIWLIQNPHAIGEFFGNIVNGFQAAK